MTTQVGKKGKVSMAIDGNTYFSFKNFSILGYHFALIFSSFV